MNQKESLQSIYPKALQEIADASKRQSLLKLFAQQEGRISLENMLLLLYQTNGKGLAHYQTLEEWNTQDRKVIFGESSSVRLYAPSGFQGKSELEDDRAVVSLFTQEQTVHSEKYHKDTAEHPFSQVTAHIPEPTDADQLQMCVKAAISCMQTTGCGMPIFEEPGEYVTLEHPVRYDPGGNQLYLAKGASYADTAFALLREAVYCKQYQPMQPAVFYEQAKYLAASAAQVMMYRTGFDKQFPFPETTLKSTAYEKCLQQIPTSLQALQADYQWINKRLEEESREVVQVQSAAQKIPNAQAALAAAPNVLQEVVPADAETETALVILLNQLY